MKRRVQYAKENKRVLRLLHTSQHLIQPYTVLVDASFIRAAHDAKCPSIVELLTNTFQSAAPPTQKTSTSMVKAHFNDATISVLQRTAPSTLENTHSLLEGISRWNLSREDGERNERKAILSLLGSIGSTQHVFVATLAHDLRNSLAGQKQMSIVDLVYDPLRARIRLPAPPTASTTVRLPTSTNTPVGKLSEKDQAFMASLGLATKDMQKKQKQIQQKRRIAAQQKQEPPSNDELGFVEWKAASGTRKQRGYDASGAQHPAESDKNVSQVQRKKPQKKAQQANPNPLSMRKKRPREVYISPDALK